MRTLNEILDDVDLANKMPKTRVQSVFNRVLQQMATNENVPRGTQLFNKASERYKNLSSTERAKLESQVEHEREILATQRRSNKLLHKLDTKPPTPYSIFCKSEVARGKISKYISLSTTFRYKTRMTI